MAGEIIKESSKSGNYKVKYYVLDGEEHVDLVSVSDLTSTTLQEEKERHEHHHSSTIIQWYLSYFLFISLYNTLQIMMIRQPVQMKKSLL